jgi:hypothetical protein
MRRAPEWFQEELKRIGGTNQYGEAIFRLSWSTDLRIVVGGRWVTGFEGYKISPGAPGDPCWCLEVWEPASVAGGSYEAWQRDFRDEETGLLQCGGYPKYGAYRVLQKFIHREIVQQPQERHFMDGPHIRREVIAKMEMRLYRMEPCGFMLDVMLPMLMAWKRLSNAQKTAALKQQERMRQDEYMKAAKNVREGVKLSRVMRGSQLIQKRAEIVERGLRQACAAAAQWGLGSRVEA